MSAETARSAEAAPLPEALVACLVPGEMATVTALQRLSGGANMETWAFELQTRTGTRRLIVRRRPPGIPDQAVAPQQSATVPAVAAGISLETEAALIGLAARAGVPVAPVVALSAPDSALGEALIMPRLEGEALPRRFLGDERYVAARRRLAFECGEALAKLHAAPLEECPPGLRDLDWPQDLDRLQGLCDHFGNPSPAHQLAINWLREQPPPSGPRVLCHGDFRSGNLLIGERGLNAVLDWELAHVGYAAEDLGYLCANVWRFGSDKPVGGFGDYRELLDGYRSVRGDAPTLGELRRWELYAALGWGLVCLTMLEMHRSGTDAGLERAAVGRRVSESEIDILLLLEELSK